VCVQYVTVYKCDTLQDGAVDNAIKMCKTAVVNDDVDGTVEGTWLLTE